MCLPVERILWRAKLVPEKVAAGRKLTLSTTGPLPTLLHVGARPRLFYCPQFYILAYLVDQPTLTEASPFGTGTQILNSKSRLLPLHPSLLLLLICFISGNTVGISSSGPDVFSQWLLTHRFSYGTFCCEIALLEARTQSQVTVCSWTKSTMDPNKVMFTIIFPGPCP